MTLAILLAIATCWGFWMWKRPLQAFAALPFVLPTYVIRASIGPLPTTLLELIILATVAAWLIKEIGDLGSESGKTKKVLTRISNLWPLISPWKWPIGLWLLAGLIGIFVSPNHISALGLYRAYFIEPILIFIIGLDLLKQRETEGQHMALSLRASMAWVVILLGIYAIIQMLTGWGIPDPWNFIPGRRAVGPFPFPNALALFVTPIAALCFNEFIRSFEARDASITMRDASMTGATRGVAPTVALMGFVAGLVCNVLAASDGGLIALGAAAFVAMLLSKKTRLLAIGLAVAGTIFIASVAPLREKVTTVLMFREWSAKVRIVMWQETLLMLKDHKIFGAGLGGYPFVIRVYHKSGNWMEVFQYPHNVFLNLWSETGLLGLGAFGWILVGWGLGTMDRGREKKEMQTRLPHVLRPTSYTLPIIIAILVHGLVDVPYFKNDLAVLFWLLILTTITTLNKTTDRV